MQMRTFKAKLAKVAAVAAVVAVGAALIADGTVAGADPKQSDNPLVGVGSDTTQDVLDAFTGEVNGTRFIPVRSGSRINLAGQQVGQKQLASWRAVQLDSAGNPVPCIEPAGGIAVDRPNGSSNGRRALAAAFNSVGWGRPDVGCTTEYASMAGLVDFARSSSASDNATGNVTQVPFARDALQFAYSAPSTAAAVSTLTVAQIQGLHTSPGAVLNVGGTRIIACRIQDGSGTYESWGANMGLNLTSSGPPADETTLENATAECAGEFDTVQTGIDGVQEHDPQGLYDVCERIRVAQPTTQCIIGYSVANWVAQFNGVGSRSLDVDGVGTDAPPTASTGGAFNIGVASDLSGGAAGQPGYNIASGVASPNTTYYGGTWGRDVYNVIPTGVITAPGFDDIREMLLCDGPDGDTDCDFNAEGPGSGPALCTAAAAVTRNLLGFGAPVGRPCGAYGGFLKRGFELTCTGPIGQPEVAC